MQSSGSRGARRQPDPVVHDVDADEQLPILDADELVVVVGTAEEAEESLGEWKLAGLCGTPGCYKPDFHDGVCTPDEVSGSRRRKISSGFSGGCGPGSSRSSHRSNNRVPSSSDCAQWDQPRVNVSVSEGAGDHVDDSHETCGSRKRRVRNRSQRSLGQGSCAPRPCVAPAAAFAQMDEVAAQAVEARGEVPQSITARAAAAAEGLELVPSSSSETG